MTTYLLIYRTNRNGLLKSHVANYFSRNDCKHDIRANGYRCVAVLNERQVNEIMAGNFSPNLVVKYAPRVLSYLHETVTDQAFKFEPSV